MKSLRDLVNTINGLWSQLKEMEIEIMTSESRGLLLDDHSRIHLFVLGNLVMHFTFARSVANDDTPV